MMSSGVGGVAISVPFAHRYCCPMPIGSTLSVLAARVCVPALRVRQLLLVWSSGPCVSQVGGRGRVGSTAWFGRECHPPRDADPMVVFLDARSITPRCFQTPVYRMTLSAW